MANVFFCIFIFVFVFLSMRAGKTVNSAHSKCIFVFVIAFVSMGTKRKGDLCSWQTYFCICIFVLILL